MTASTTTSRQTRFSRRLILTGASLLVVSLLVYGVIDYYYQWTKFQAFAMREIRSVALATQDTLDVEKMLNLSREFKRDDPVLYQGDEFFELRKPLMDLSNDLGRGIPIYTLQIPPAIYEEIRENPHVDRKDGTWFLLMSSEKPFFKHTYDYRAEMAECLFEGKVVEVPPYEDKHGSWLSVYVPLRSSDKESPVALLEVDYRLDQLKKELRNVFFVKWSVLILLAFLFLLLLYLISKRLSHHLENLTDQAQAYSDGKEDIKFSINSGDEVQVLAETLEEARLKQIEIQDLLVRARDRLEESDRNKEEVLNVLSHELRTPMNGIIGVTSLLDGEIDEGLQKVLDRSLNRMKTLIENVEAYIIIDAMDLPEKDELCSLVAMVNDWKSTRGHDDVKFDTDFLSESIKINRRALESILYQVLDNAYKFGEGGTIRIGSGRQPLCVWIEDSGKMIPRREREKIFRPFYQIDMSVTRDQEGLGMGLAIARKHAQKIGGVLFHEEGDSGNRFVFRMGRA